MTRIAISRTGFGSFGDDDSALVSCQNRGADFRKLQPGILRTDQRDQRAILVHGLEALEIRLDALLLVVVERMLLGTELSGRGRRLDTPRRFGRTR